MLIAGCNQGSAHKLRARLIVPSCLEKNQAQALHSCANLVFWEDGVHSHDSLCSA